MVKSASLNLMEQRLRHSIEMSNIYDKLLADIKSAMISKDNVKRDCLRSIVSEIKNQSINAGKELTDAVCVNVLKKVVKQHNDSIESFKVGKREDLALKEMEELRHIRCYLPKMLSEEATQMLVLKLIADNKIEEKKSSLGKVMKLLNLLPEKDQIDKKYVSSYLGTLLK